MAWDDKNYFLKSAVSGYRFIRKSTGLVLLVAMMPLWFSIYGLLRLVSYGVGFALGFINGWDKAVRHG